MAPSCPEEVDVFTVPHSRMKELVCKYLDMLTATNLSNAVHLATLLEKLIKTFQEFIAHEEIENQFIMKKLKNKLRSLSIQNTAVCNCHKDNSIGNMLQFLRDGYRCTKKTDVDLTNYGLQLRQALETFTEDFLPHMEEEEEVFQPLLMQHFTIEELKQIKATVLQQHFKLESEEVPEKFVTENKSGKPESATGTGGRFVLENVPDEIMINIFSHLNPQELCHSAQVCRRWNMLAMDGCLWSKLYPVSWAAGNWNADSGVNEEDSVNVCEKLNSKDYDEDADVDETDDWNSEAREIQHQSHMLTAMCKHLLPRVGKSIKYCDLAYSKGLTNGSLYKILSLCPNMQYLDLTQTRVSDLGFKGFRKERCGKNLHHLDLSGCLYITDLALQKLSSAMGHIPCHMTEVEGQLTDHGHMTVIDKETTNKDKVCTDCKENRKNEVCGSWKERKAGNPGHEIRETDQNVGPRLNHANGERMSCKDNKQNGYCYNDSPGECQKNKDCLQRCDAKTRNDRKAKLVEHGCKTNRPVNGRQCCYSNSGDDTNVPKYNDDAYYGSKVDQMHDQKFDSESTDTQDMSWIKPGEGHEGGRSEASDHSLQENAIDQIRCTNQISGECRNDQKNIKNRCDDGEIYSSGQEGMLADYNPEQTYLPDYILLCEVNAETDVYTKTNSVDEVDDSELETSGKPNKGKDKFPSRCLEFLSLSGCYQITDDGLNYLTNNGGLPRLKHLDLSGCPNLEGEAVVTLVKTAVHLDPAHLFYCDNILDGPYADTASGCQNLQCGSRICCRCGE